MQTVRCCFRELYTEINCPKNDSELSILVEEYFNIGEMVEYRCESCGYNGLAEKKSTIQDIRSTKFLTVILRRTELHSYK